MISLSLVTPIRGSRPLTTTTTEKTSSINPVILSNNDESISLIESKASALVSTDHRQSRFINFQETKSQSIFILR